MIRLAKTKYGTYEGVTSLGGHALFRGIRYAKAPTGALRFAPPEEPEAFEGIRKADTYGAAAMQGPFQFHDGGGHLRIPMEGYPYPPAMSEDCLFLNVYTPAETAGDHLPVMFYIHGGALQTWYGSCYEYCGDGLADHGAVVVTIHYRLNIFGFFAHPELSAESPNHASGNYGILDMIAALRWTKENIAAFGGDPENITIFGQSGGARGVQAISCSPLTEGLYRHAAMHSGGGIDPFPGIEGYKSMTDRGVDFVSFAGVSSVRELREMPAPILMQHYLEYSRMHHLTFNLYADGYVLPLSVEEAARQGKYHPADYLMGCTIDEGHKGGSAMFARICPATRLFARLLSESGQAPYVYCFDRPQPGDDIGTPHSCDNRYIFRSFAESWRPYTEEDYRLSDMVETLWTNFARTGDPNGEGLPRWEKYDERRLELHIMTEGSAMEDFDPDGLLGEKEAEIEAELKNTTIRSEI